MLWTTVSRKDWIWLLTTGRLLQSSESEHWYNKSIIRISFPAYESFVLYRTQMMFLLKLKLMYYINSDMMIRRKKTVNFILNTNSWFTCRAGVNVQHVLDTNMGLLSSLYILGKEEHDFEYNFQKLWIYVFLSLFIFFPLPFQIHFPSGILEWLPMFQHLAK